MRREAVVRQGFQIGKHPDGETGPGEESNFVPQGLCIARILRNDDEGSVRTRRRLRNGQCRSGAVEFSPLDDGRVGFRQIG